ncbi:hypothetical protein [Deinococcus ruber]|uniref:Uncharacterized protein n=1 Tax=Deinococcus ruber TaxID=1848197 RepID=A0A918CDZ6_9DEIO|nr:hypothetical protein [Deinococcus ruber]GGR17423.1 hypothetical protein GCM10008957_32640 [Deinococcus ruber]
MTLLTSAASAAEQSLPPGWTACAPGHPTSICCPSCGLVWGQLAEQTLTVAEERVLLEEGTPLLEVQRSASGLLTHGRLETGTCARCDGRFHFMLLWALKGEVVEGLEEVLALFLARQPLPAGAGFSLLQSPTGLQWLTQTLPVGAQRIGMSLPWATTSSTAQAWMQEQAAAALGVLVGTGRRHALASS